MTNLRCDLQCKTVPYVYQFSTKCHNFLWSFLTTVSDHVTFEICLRAKMTTSAHWLCYRQPLQGVTCITTRSRKLYDLVCMTRWYVHDLPVSV